MGPQNHQTPSDFMDAVKRRFGKIVFDLAAESGIEQAPEYFDKEDDSLVQDWAGLFKLICPNGDGWFWLNPPFSGGENCDDEEKSRTLENWMRKCWEESQRGARILSLVPHSSDTNWWDNWVRGKGRDEALRGRIKFVGALYPFMKPLALIVYEPGVSGGNGGAWRWKEKKKAVRKKKK
jgi:hypothetical protein